ncbi:DNA polymerase III subunit delta' [Catenovulum sp. SM1970]|uniref:DNA polymerase III subunit delta' n=1 Tax=Marinifaba aquimaris TaxID=2741323 RepID=UPI001574C79B|nr:DNA polymerase III subunit delta' [Marinifaba aquimaris]NTS77965.1 DNA polymerase III subunit delta' [Marinifaba aquimaris]
MHVIKELTWLRPLSDKLEQQLQLNRLHHALLFDATEGVGKYEFAKSLANRLLCNQAIDGQACGQCKSCHLFNNGSHPDYLEFADDTANSIGVEQIRAIVNKAQQKSQQGGALVFVIKNCEKMTDSAANALLKTLEEPNPHTYLLLTTSAISHLLPTILSRCQLHRVNSPTEIQLNEWVARQGIEQSDFLVAYQDSGHAPLKASALLADNYIEKRTNYLSQFKQLLAGRISAFDFFADFQESELNHYYIWLMQALNQWLSVKSKQADQSVDKSAQLVKISSLYQAVQHNYANVNLNGINKKLNYQQLCHKIEAILQE